MAPTLQLNLLGTLELALDGQPLLALRSQKAIALLVYLACNPGPQRREFLADLFWDASSTAQSLSNLRTVLSRLRPYTDDYLLITPETIAIAPDCDLHTDVAVLEKELSLTPEHLSAGSAFQLAEALGLYRGDFLTGFYLRDASGFEQWTIVERERLRFLITQSYRRLVAYYLQKADYPAGIHAARAWLGLDPTDEEAHAQLIRLLAYSGQRSAALTQFENCRQILQAELDIEPSDELQTLHRQISAGDIPAPALTSVETRPSPSIRHSAPVRLPPRLTSFVGREEDVAAICARFAQPDRRLITLVGEGGVGKSSLALGVGEAILSEAKLGETTRDNWSDGVCFVSLAEVEASPEVTLPHRLATALAQAVGLLFSTSPGATEPARQLFDFLRDRSLLLILDNFEHLIAGTSFVTELRRAAPGCRLLITARQPLQIEGESVVRLVGLPVPPQNAALPLPDAAYASVALFVERARQRLHTFALSSDDRQALGHLCRLVAGNALALELAAAWVEHYSLPEMTALLEANILDFLHSPRPGANERHRSLRRVMETSWGLLTREQQETLAQLSLFRGSFQRDAALTVTGSRLAQLAELVNSSLVQQRGPGRYELHEMVHQFSAEKLDLWPDGGEASAERYARYYLALVGRVERTPKQIGQISQELANVRQAWSWAVEKRNVAGLAGASSGLWNFYLRKGLFQEAEEAFGRAIDAVLATTTDTVGRRRALASLRVAQAVFLNIRSHFTEAIAVAEEAIGYGLQEENEAIIAQGYLQWGTALYRQGRYSDAVKRFQMALVAAEDAGLAGDQADILRQLGVAWMEQGDFAQAQGCGEEALALYRRTGNRLGEGNTLTDIGWMNQRQQKFEEARTYLEEAQRVHESIDNRHGVTIALLNLGIVRQMLGKFSSAYDAYQQLLQHLSDQPDRYHHSLVNHSLGVLLTRMGDYPTARRHLMTALEIDRSTGDRGGLAWSYNALGMIHNHLGDPKTGLAYHKQALEIGQEQGAATVEGIAWLGIGQDLQALGQWAQAQSAYENAIVVQSKLAQNIRVIESRGGLSRCLLALDTPAPALEQVEQILDYLATQPLLGAAQPALVYWNCYTVLRALEDDRAPALLAQAFEFVQRQAARIQDEHLRHSYLHELPPHPAILHEVESLRLSPRFSGIGVSAPKTGYKR